MADLKISQLTDATTPLAGTEVVPLVQSSTTKKVSIANLTAGRDVASASTTGTKTNSSGVVTGLTTENFISNNPANGNGAAVDFKLNNNGNPGAAKGRIAAINQFYGDRADLVLYSWNGALNEVLRMAWNGTMISTGVYSTTVGATNRDVYVDDTGVIGYVSSTRATKTNIKPLEDVSWLDALTPVTFNYKQRINIVDERGAVVDQVYVDEPCEQNENGLIADDVEQINPDLCFYDETPKGKILRGINYSKLVVPLLKKIQILEARIAALEAK